MSNVAFVTIKGGRINAKNLDLVLHKIVRNRWKDQISITGGDGSWQIDREGLVHIHVHLRNPRRIAMKPVTMALTGWVLTYVQYALASHFGGICSDEGVSERWYGDPRKVDTYEKWYKLAHGRFSASTMEIEEKYQKHLQWLSPRLPEGFPL